MQIEKYFHKCGYPILEVKKPMGLVVDTFFLDGNTPFLQAKDGKQNPNVIKRCPECGGFIALEKLLSEKPPRVEGKRGSQAIFLQEYSLKSRNGLRVTNPSRGMFRVRLNMIGEMRPNLVR